MSKEYHEGPLYDAARALRRAAAQLEAFAEVDEHVMTTSCKSEVHEAAQKSRMSRAHTEIEVALVRMNGYS